MPWNFNFCSPHIPNDPVMNLHRQLQIGSLVGLLIFYMFIHIYLKIFGPGTQQSQKQQQSKSTNFHNVGDQTPLGNQRSKNSDQNSDDKLISAGSQSENASYVTFNSKDKTQRKKRRKSKQVSVKDKKSVTLDQVQTFFPIVFGHFGIAVAASSMYSPYGEQTLSCFVYDFLAIILLFMNWKRNIIGLRVVWGIMSLLNSFLLLSSLLEVGQSNYNVTTKQCFSVNYKPLY